MTKLAPLRKRVEDYTEFYTRISEWIEMHGKPVYTEVGKIRYLEEFPKHVPTSELEKYERAWNHFLYTNLGEDWMIGKRAETLFAYHFKLVPRLKVKKHKGVYRLFDTKLKKFVGRWKWPSLPELEIIKPRGKTKYVIRDKQTKRFVKWIDKPYDLVVEEVHANLEV